MLTATQRQQRARIAALKRHRGDAPEVQAEASAFKAQRLAEYIKKAVDEAPPLSPEQRQRLAVLLSDGAA